MRTRETPSGPAHEKNLAVAQPIYLVSVSGDEAGGHSLAGNTESGDPMTRSTLFSFSLAAAIYAAPAFANPGDRAEEYLDRKGDRIEHRLDRKGDRIDRRLDRKGDRIDRRLDHKGDRVDRRLDRKGDRVDRRLDRKGNRISRRWDRKHK